ncbi:hypothetical protein BDW42DRAFT_182356 [Aspergillus taichungensis]|uniref:Uncharacterized protein n=1 Tax=Aspergillus taichungensis TaxID=482145 RepID=A0A2J5I9V6_9EURO|nr:hypothetical protein BDW42DRAFT_182356 [Aspergillus taichungensis]
MCQMIVFWHSCGHLYASYLRCPFKGLDRHEEELATAATVDAECWACKVTECPVSRSLKTTLLTVEHLEGILGESSTDPGFLDSVIGFYAHGDHSRYWGQPGHRKAGYVVEDSYMDDMRAEVYLETAARTGKLACNAGFAFDLKIAQAAQNDPQNNNNINWFARGAYPKNPFYYQSSNTSLFQPPRKVPRPKPRDGGEVRRLFPPLGEFIHKSETSKPRYSHTTTLNEHSLLASVFRPGDASLSTENSLTSEIPQARHDTTGSIHKDSAIGNSNKMILSLSTNVNGPVPYGVESSAANSLALPFQRNVVVPTQSDVADPFVDTVTSFVPNITTPSLSNDVTTPFLERLIDSMQNNTASLTQNERTSRIQTNAVAPIQGDEKNNMHSENATNTINDNRVSHDMGKPIGEDNPNGPVIVSPNDGSEVSSHGHSFIGAQRVVEYFQNQRPQNPQKYQEVFSSSQGYYQITHPTPTPTAEAFREPSMDPASPELPPIGASHQTFSRLHDVGVFMLDNVSMVANPPSSDTIEDWSTTYGQDSVGDVMLDDDRETAIGVYPRTE